MRNGTAWGNAPGNKPRNAPALKARHPWGQPLTQAFNITRRWRSLEFKLPLIIQELLFARGDYRLLFASVTNRSSDVVFAIRLYSNQSKSAAAA
ncbi:MAG TPA: hypothetical protein VHQ95_15145, partial [Pyrinomonadaceae bacterium]|nr:hypothetical protein [Pyrinomonadaceae bacterium]